MKSALLIGALAVVLGATFEPVILAVALVAAPIVASTLVGYLAGLVAHRGLELLDAPKRAIKVPARSQAAVAS